MCNGFGKVFHVVFLKKSKKLLTFFFDEAFFDYAMPVALGCEVLAVFYIIGILFVFFLSNGS